MLFRVEVHGFEWSTMDCQVCLLVACNIDASHCMPTFYRRLEDARQDGSTAHRDLSGSADVERDDVTEKCLHNDSGGLFILKFRYSEQTGYRSTKTIAHITYASSGEPASRKNAKANAASR